MQTITDDLRALLLSKLQIGPDGFGGYVHVAGVDYPCENIIIDKSLRMQADQMTVVLSNEALALGWGAFSEFPTNTRIHAYQWYGSRANKVRTFDGIIDNPVDHRDPISLTFNCRDRFGILIDQTFRASDPQGAGEDGAVRTEDNGVYLNREVSYIANDILDRAGWPTVERDIAETSMVLTEFILTDGTSYADQIIGSDRLTGLTGYDAWSDEHGFFRFGPTPSSDIVEVPDEPTWTWRTGHDITELTDSTDQYELITRVKARGPMSVTTTSDGWHLIWQTKKVPDPVGIWFDPSDPDYIRVISNSTKKLYKLRDSDRQIVSSVYLGSEIAHPLGISGDPADASIYWVLNAPWIDGGSGGNEIVKVRKSDNAVRARYSIASGRWSAIKVSSSYIWLTNLDTDEFHKMNKATGAQIGAFHHTYASHTQTNPSGLMIDGTTLHIFWANGGTTARFLICDESSPTVVDHAVATSGSTLHGGEMDTLTHTECWGDNDSLGLTAKFSLVTTSTNPTIVSAEVVNTQLEDELGELAELQDRVHDTHPGDAAHPWESRRYTMDLMAISNPSQAGDTAKFWLDKLGRRRRVVDAGIVGNPAVQKNDLVRVEDPLTGLFQNFVLDTIHTEMSSGEGGTYLGTVSLVRGGVANDEITEPDPPPSDGDAGSDPEPAPFTFDATFVYTSDGYGLSSGPPAVGVNHTVSSTDTTPFRLYEGDVVSYSFDLTGDSRDSRCQFGFASGVASWVSFHYDDGGLSPPQSISGSYTVIAATGIGGPHGGVGAADLWFMSELDAFSHSPHTTTVVAHITVVRS